MEEEDASMEEQDALASITEKSRSVIFTDDICNNALDAILKFDSDARYIAVGELFAFHPECASWWNKKLLQVGAAGPAASPKSLAGLNARVLGTPKDKMNVALRAYEWGIGLKVQAGDVAVAAVEASGKALSRLCEALEERPWRQEFERDQMIQLAKGKLAEKWTDKLEDKIRQCGRRLIPAS